MIDLMLRLGATIGTWKRAARTWYEANKRIAAPAFIALAAAILIVLPFGFADYWRAVFVTALEFSLLALGLNVVVGFAGLLDLGYIAFYAIGHYTFAIVTARDYSKALFLEGGQNLPPIPDWAMWMWLLLAAAVLVTMVSGIVLGAPTLRLRGDYLAIVTLGFGEIVRIVARNLDSVTIGSRGITNIPHPEIPGYKFGLAPIGYYFTLLIVIALMIFMIVRLNHSRIGRGWHAIREDEVAAAAMGVPTVRMKLLAFAIGASTAGAAGFLTAARVGYVSPERFPLLESILVLAAVVLGGMGSIPGSIIGAFAIIVIPEYIRSRSPAFQEYRFLVFGAILVLMMIYRPQGLWPSKRRAIELTEHATSDATLYGASSESGSLGGTDGTP